MDVTYGCIRFIDSYQFYVRHGRLFYKAREINSFKQCIWLPDKKNSYQKRNQAINDIEEDFYDLLINSFYGKTMENVQKGLQIIFPKKDDNEIIKQQPKLNFNGNTES